MTQTGFKRIPGLPAGTIISCYCQNSDRLFGTSTGNLIIHSSSNGSEFSLAEKAKQIIRLNGPVRFIRGAGGGTEDIFACVSDYHLFIVLLPKLGSILKQPEIIEEKIESSLVTIGSQESIFIAEGQTVHLGRVTSNFKFEKVPFIHARSNVIQLEQNKSTILVCTSSSIMVSPSRNQDVKVLVELNDQFLPSIVGCDFVSENNNSIVYCDESGNIRIISASGELVWETFQSYHTGFLPGPLLCFKSSISTHPTLYSKTQSSISMLKLYEKESDPVSLPVTGKLTSLCVEDSAVLCVSSGYAYEYSERLRDQMAYVRNGNQEGVELSDALNSAKGFLFGLRKTLGDGMKKVKPSVDRLSKNIDLVSEKISKEIFDDEIYERANFDSFTEPKVETGLNAEELLPQDQKDDPEPIKVQRAITNRIKKFKNSPPKMDSESRVDKSVEQSQQSFNCMNTATTPEPFAESNDTDKDAIDSALLEAFQKLDQNIEVNQETGSKQIEIKPKNTSPKNTTRPDEVVSSPLSAKSNTSWVLVDDEEYGEI